MKNVEEIIEMIEKKIEYFECAKTLQWNSFEKAGDENAKQAYFSYYLEAGAKQTAFKNLLKEIKEN